METAAFDFILPEGAIAQHPVEPRDRSRLMVLRPDDGTWEHRIFADLPELLRPGDVLVRNTTRVIPARLIGYREGTGGKWEGLFLREASPGRWLVLMKTRGRLAEGERIVVEGGLTLVLDERDGPGRWVASVESRDDAAALLERHGHVPIPPYVRKGRDDPTDRLRYQTVYARDPGAVAAPTAGLHFTEKLFDRLARRGVRTVDVTLHVGLGTFRPIEAQAIEDHILHAEWAEVSEAAARELESARGAGGRVVAVGTTSARALETAARGGDFRPFASETALYLRPGHTFRGLDALVTNFHLPRSSLIVLVAALAGTEFVRDAYAEAIREGYRFYSYGDAMLILPSNVHPRP